MRGSPTRRIKAIRTALRRCVLMRLSLPRTYLALGARMRCSAQERKVQTTRRQTLKSRKTQAASRKAGSKDLKIQRNTRKYRKLGGQGKASAYEQRLFRALRVRRRRKRGSHVSGRRLFRPARKRARPERETNSPTPRLPRPEIALVCGAKRKLAVQYTHLPPPFLDKP